ncbi:MAG TPA: pilus assembly protein PilM, partial [Rhodoferax sp.]|nr:pilus assembly protein PilM [Rhodoferax sp.]
MLKATKLSKVNQVIVAQKSLRDNALADSIEVIYQEGCRFFICKGMQLFSLGSLFSRQPAAMLGLDISSSSVKLVELGRDKAGCYVLENYAILPLERGWITDGNIVKFDEVADAVRRLIKKSGTKTR